MRNQTFSRPVEAGALLFGLLSVPWALVGAAQETPEKTDTCYSYRVDESKNRVYFNNPKIYIVIPDKLERDRLRLEGTPAQVFVMKDCDTPDDTATIKVFQEPGETANKPSEEIFSATPVLVLAEQSSWVQIKGRTKMWMGKGWIQVTDKTVVVKY